MSEHDVSAVLSVSGVQQAGAPARTHATPQSPALQLEQGLLRLPLWK